MIGDSKFWTLSGWFIGLISLAFGLWAYYDTKAAARISYQTVSREVFSPPLHFQPEVTTQQGGHTQTTSEAIQQTVLLIWNSGNISVSPTDIRLPLSISLNKSGDLKSFKLVEASSSLPDNFTLEQSGDAQLTIRWRAFDPDMAVKLAILHPSATKPHVSGAFGPNISLQEYNEASTTHWLLVVIGFALGPLAMVFLFGSIIFNVLKQMEWDVGARTQRLLSGLMGIAAVCASLGGAFGGALLADRITGASPLEIHWRDRPKEQTDGFWFELLLKKD